MILLKPAVKSFGFVIAHPLEDIVLGTSVFHADLYWGGGEPAIFVK